MSQTVHLNSSPSTHFKSAMNRNVCWKVARGTRLAMLNPAPICRYGYRLREPHLLGRRQGAVQRQHAQLLAVGRPLQRRGALQAPDQPRDLWSARQEHQDGTRTSLPSRPRTIAAFLHTRRMLSERRTILSSASSLHRPADPCLWCGPSAGLRSPQGSMHATHPTLGTDCALASSAGRTPGALSAGPVGR